MSQVWMLLTGFLHPPHIPGSTPNRRGGGGGGDGGGGSDDYLALCTNATGISLNAFAKSLEG